MSYSRRFTCSSPTARPTPSAALQAERLGYNIGGTMSAPNGKPEDEGRWDSFHAIAERKIREAMEEGLFDNLPGKGKPLDLDDDPLTPAHLRIVHHVLKNANVVPEWVLREREIETAKQAATDFLARWEADRAAGVARDPAHARAEYHALMRKANDLILKFNVVNPFGHRAPVPFLIKERLADWDARYPQCGAGNANP